MASCPKLFPRFMNADAARFRVYFSSLMRNTTPRMLITITAKTPSPKDWSLGFPDKTAQKPNNNKGGNISIITIIKAAIKQPLDFLVFLNLGGFSVGVSVSGCCGSECMCNTSK